MVIEINVNSDLLTPTGNNVIMECLLKFLKELTDKSISIKGLKVRDEKQEDLA